MDVSYLKSDFILHAPYTSFTNLLKLRANEQRNSTAFVFIDHQDGNRSEITFGQLYSESLKLAKGLAYLGVKKGDIIGLSGRNSPEWLISSFGIMMAGGCALYFPFHYKDGTDVIQLLNSIGNVKMVIFDEGQAGDNKDIMKRVAVNVFQDGRVESSEVPSLERVLLFSKSNELTFSFSITNLIASAYEMDLPNLDPDDQAAILLSSGTSGLPKAIPHSHHSLVIMAWQFYENFFGGCSNQSVYYNDRPFNWGAGYPLWVFASGGTRVTVKNPSKDFTIKNISDMTSKHIKDEGVSIAVFIPPLIDYLVKQKGRQFKLKRLMTCGMIISSSLLKSVGNLCDELMVAYGVTEVAGVSSWLYTEADKCNYTLDTLTTKPLPENEIKVMNERGVVAQVGETGRIHVRSSKKFTGYLNHELPYKDVLVRCGWFDTEDGGYVTEGGSLVVEGRMKEILAVSGKKLHPSVIENIIKTKESIKDAVVLPLKEIETGYIVPCAAVISLLKSGRLLNEIRMHIREKCNVNNEGGMIESLYLPRFVVNFEDFPNLPNGKLDKKALKILLKENIDSEKYSLIQ